MILHYMSASRIKTYLQCPNQYHEKYENKVKDGNVIHLTFGTLIHSVFERYFQEDADLVELYEEEWNKADIADPQFFKDGYEIIENFRAMTDRDEATPIGFEIPFAIDIESGKIYDTSEVDFDDSEQVREFIDMLKEEDAPIIFGFIDRVDYDADKDLLRIVDYKTSKIPLSQNEADEDVQLSMYALVASYLYPEYSNISLELHYVREGTPVVTSRTDDELEMFKKWLLSIYAKIKDDTTHEAILNKYCGWCSAKHKCRAYQELINGDIGEDISIDGMTDEELDEQLEKINISKKIIEDRKKEIETYFKDKLKDSDNAPIDVGDGSRFVTNNARISYDPITVMTLFPDRFDKLVTVKKSDVDKLVKGNEELKQELESTGRKYYISPTLRKRKSK